MNLETAQKALKKYFGYESFYTLQEDALENIYAGKDSVVVMPTGGGKSVCYQIPAVTVPGAVVVISPTISLMKDQVDSLNVKGIKATVLNSTQSVKEQEEVREQFRNGDFSLLYISPEKVMSEVGLFKNSDVSLFAIDEAHCVSTWGHDFRPAYRALTSIKEQFPDVPVAALTATADRVTRLDIEQQLQLDSPKLFLQSFDRKNIRLAVRPGQKRKEQIFRFLKAHENETGIIYCTSRKQCEQFSEKLVDAGYKADYYHAGLSAKDRDSIQNQFLEDEITVLCATIAFGMGIDKPNVRWVIHYNLPQNLESYYQEIGRAGRDGLPADTMMFFTFADVRFIKERIGDDNQNKELLESKLERLIQYSISPVCRRKTLLSYFGEFLDDDCGNCDICNNPPEVFDGTEIAQKALSAVHWTGGQANMNLLIGVLRGLQFREIFDSGFHEIKTYGAGKDLSHKDWQSYIEQLIHQGYLDIALEENLKIRLTDASKQVIGTERQTVNLVRPAIIEEREQAEKASNRNITSPSVFDYDDDLYDLLKRWRMKEARARDKPAYIVFNNKTLEMIAMMRPINDAQLLSIPGVGESKCAEFGEALYEQIREYADEAGLKEDEIFTSVSSVVDASVKQTQEIKKKDTLSETFTLYSRGFGVVEIARERNLAENTVVSHLIQLAKRGKRIDLEQMIDDSVLDMVSVELELHEPPVRLKTIYEALDEEVSYSDIKIAMACLGLD